MVQTIDDIINSKLKPKEKLAKLSAEIAADKRLVPAVIARFNEGKDPVKGLCIEALERVSLTNPEFIAPHLDFITAQLEYKAPRVQWEAARIIGNLAKRYPDKVAAAIPALLGNTDHPGTVVGWSAAFAICEIAKYNEAARKKLLPRLKSNEMKESNNGVKKLYTRALSSMSKRNNQ